MSRDICGMWSRVKLKISICQFLNGINAIKRVSEIYNINYKDRNINECEEFENEKIYESMLMKKIEKEQNKNTLLNKKELERNKDMVSKIIEKDGVKVIGLIGNNGKISEEEIIRNYQNIIRK